MEYLKLGGRSKSDLHLQMSRTIYRRDDDPLSLYPAVDLKENRWTPNPLSGPSTRRTTAIEARALDMIASTDDLNEAETHENADGDEDSQARLTGWLSLSALSTARWKGKKRKANLKAQPRSSDKSDDSLVMIDLKDALEHHLSYPGQQPRFYRPLANISTPEQKAEAFKAKITKDRDITDFRLPSFFFEGETSLTAIRQRDASTYQQSSESRSAELVSTKAASAQQHSQSSQHEPADSRAEEVMSVLELPPPRYNLYRQREYQNWGLNGGFFTPEHEDREREIVSSDVGESLVLSINTPTSSSMAASVALADDWRHVEQDESSMGVGSPPASLMIEDMNSRIYEPVDLGSVQESSRRNSSASSGLGQSECILPTIYPGMDQYQPPSNCSGELNESWSNTSRSLFDSTPHFNHRVISNPIRLRGGAGKDPTRSASWRFFLGKKPVGDAGKGELLLESPVGFLDNFFLGRRGPRKTGRELCEEAERRVAKGKEIQKRGERNKKAKKEKKKAKKAKKAGK